MIARVETLRQALEEPLLVTNLVNVRYLAGFRSSNAALLVADDAVTLFADFRYAEAARSVAGVEFVQTARSLLGDVGARLAGRRIGFEAESMTYAGYETLAAAGAELVPRRGLVERLRAVKDDTELDAIRRAAAIADRAYARIADERFTGRTERELAWRMEQLFREESADELAFPIIFAAGANGARPHADSGDRVVERGQLVVIDAGCTVDGYCSDCTRTFATGRLPERLRRAYDVCLDAQQAAVEAVRAGVSGKEADAAARERIDASEFAGAFGHGLGHGVGMAVHESPGLRPESDDVLEAGNVVTVEPGIYLEGEGGVRIEDLVVVTEDGADVLSRFTKEHVEVA